MDQPFDYAFFKSASTTDTSPVIVDIRGLHTEKPAMLQCIGAGMRFFFLPQQDLATKICDLEGDAGLFLASTQGPQQPSSPGKPPATGPNGSRNLPVSNDNMYAFGIGMHITIPGKLSGVIMQPPGGRLRGDLNKPWVSVLCTEFTADVEDGDEVYLTAPEQGPPGLGCYMPTTTNDQGTPWEIPSWAQAIAFVREAGVDCTLNILAPRIRNG